MTVCKLCKGIGRVGVYEPAELTDCPSCDGKGVVEPLTNEEWLRQANTEELAEWMVMLQLVGVYPIKRGSVDTEMFIADTVEWLKKPHTTE